MGPFWDIGDVTIPTYGIMEKMEIVTGVLGQFWDIGDVTKCARREGGVTGVLGPFWDIEGVTITAGGLGEKRGVWRCNGVFWDGGVTPSPALPRFAGEGGRPSPSVPLPQGEGGMARGRRKGANAFPAGKRVLGGNDAKSNLFVLPGG